MFLYIFAAIAIIWSATAFFMSEKYMKWYYRQYSMDFKDYDANIFKVTHSVALLTLGALAITINLTDYNRYWICLLIMLVVSIVHFFVIFKIAKKHKP